jgi:N-acetyl-gamma-glutamyl-phosphate reductase
MTTPSIFIDGEAGTTGLGIRERLKSFPQINVRSIAPELRKDNAARKALMSEVDVVILCLPDEAAKQSAVMREELIAEGKKAPRILDASTAFRVDPKWAYGFAELTAGHAQTIAKAPLVSNPGCYPTGGIALLRPLIDAGIVPADYPIAVHAVSGYSGGGKSMIEQHESNGGPAFELYGLSLEHKHVPELQLYSKLTRRPMFIPSVGHYRQGMLVNIPLHFDLLGKSTSGKAIEDTLAQHYAGSTLVNVVPTAGVADRSNVMLPEALNDTDQLELRVFDNGKHGQALLCARLDNLGKGASGAAVQNLRLMLGL